MDYQKEIEKRYDLAVLLARQGMALAETAFVRGVAVEMKDGTHDPTTFVTAVDRAVEAFIARGIRDFFPEDQVLGEEGEGHKSIRGDGFCWVIDPIDGTGNYGHGLRPWAVSVAVLLGGLPVAAAVGFEQRIYSTRGRGDSRFLDVRVDNDPLHFRVARPQQQWIIGQECDTYLAIDMVRQLKEQANSLRDHGSIVSSCIYVLTGQLDAFVCPIGAVWDHAAVALLLRNAGMRFTRWDGSDPFPHIFEDAIRDLAAYEKQVYRYDLIAAPREVHEALLPILRPHAGAVERQANKGGK